jgi:hypothetical protein
MRDPVHIAHHMENYGHMAPVSRDLHRLYFFFHHPKPVLIVNRLEPSATSNQE